MRSSAGTTAPLTGYRTTALLLALSVSGCDTSPNSTAGCVEQAPVSVSFEALPDPPQGSPWSLSDMRAGIEGLHRGTLYPISHWDEQPGDVDPELFTPVEVEIHLRSEAELIEFEDGSGPEYDCTVQDVRLYADIEVRREDGPVLATAEGVELHVSAGDEGTGGALFVPPSDALAQVLMEDVATLPDPLQFAFSFGFDPEPEVSNLMNVSGLGPDGSTRPLARAALEEQEPLGE